MRRAGSLLLTAVVLAACGATRGSAEATPTPSSVDHDAHDFAPSGAAATPHPSVPAGADGSIVLENDFLVGGSGVPVGEALDVASSRPVLVRGVLLRDTDGGIWFCERLEAGDPPTCDSPRLWVAGFGADAAVFDPANAQEVGAQTRDGVTWVAGQLLFGVVHPAP